MGDMHHAEGVFDGDALRSAGLQVDLGTAQARQDQCIATGDQVRAIELGGNLYGQRALAQGVMGARGVRGGLGKVAAQGDEHFGPPLFHGLDRQHGVVSMGTGHAELKAFFQCIEQPGLGFFVDAHAAVTLHVAVATYRRQAGAGLADVAAQQLQVDDFLHGRH
ncbi:hypothetical protein D3C79_690750 [compost metagenome]